MNYYQVVDDDMPGILVTDKEDFYGFDEWELTRIKFIDNWNPKITLYSCYDGRPQAAWSHSSWEVASPELIKAFKDADIQGIQWLPLRIIRMDGKELKGFHAINILNSFSAYDVVDFPMCYPPATKKIKDLWHIVRYAFYEDKIKQFDIFRLKEKKLWVFVSQKIKDIFKKNRFDGWGFTKVPTT
ncbi:MAG: DUF1629 domain-containing protein [Candidatus Brocadiia bacterium]